MIIQIFDQEFGKWSATLVRCKNGIIRYKIIFSNRFTIVHRKSFIGYFKLGFTIL